MRRESERTFVLRFKKKMAIEKNPPSEKRSKEGGRRKRKHSESRERKGCQEFAGGEIRNEEVQETPLFGIFEKKVGFQKRGS